MLQLSKWSQDPGQWFYIIIIKRGSSYISFLKAPFLFDILINDTNDVKLIHHSS